MQLDWITLYDYMSVSSRIEIKEKINKFYESFYPLKFKRSGRKTCELRKDIGRSGLLGILSTYIQQTLFALQAYLEAEYFMTQGRIKDQIKLSQMFVEIEKKNLEVSLQIESLVFTINEVSRVYNNAVGDKSNEKDFLEIKIICSLLRLLEFFYCLSEMRGRLNPEGYEKIENCLFYFSFEVCKKSKEYINIYPQLGQLLVQILHFFESVQKEPFNFHSHLSDDNSGKRVFPQKLKKLITVIPKLQKNILVNLTDEAFFKTLANAKPELINRAAKEAVENYFRCEEEINSIIAQEQNFVESILVSEKYRGKKEWKEKILEQYINLSVEKKMTDNSKLLEFKSFKLSEDFPLKLQ